MKKILLKDNEKLEVGTVVTLSHALGKNKYVISRVTKTLALARVNEKYEAKFPRIYDSFWFSSIPRQKWDSREYEVYNLVEE